MLELVVKVILLYAALVITLMVLFSRTMRLGKKCWGEYWGP